VRVRSALLTGAAAAAAGAGGYVGLVTGALTVDLAVGRRTRPLGPITVGIDAPRETAYAAATAPYAQRPTRAMREKVQVLQRTEHMLLAAHRTPLAGGLTATTLETVTFEAPERIGFRLLRGPVPHLTETFTFDERDGVTVLRYQGELGTDLWTLGERWGTLVARTWEAAVAASLDQIRVEAERRTTKS
jgi:hypothetical protein